MASVITATTSSGLVSSADNSGVLQLASGTGNLVTIPSVTGTAMVSGNMPAFNVYLSSGQSISANTHTKINVNTKDYDTNNCVNTSTYRVIPNVAGYYQFNWGATVGSSACGVIANLYKNGSNVLRGLQGNSTTLGNGGGSGLAYANGTTDYFELYVFFTTGQNTGAGALDVFISGFLARAA